MGLNKSQPQNQKFNPNFNMAAYNQKLNQMRNQYSHHNMDAPGAYYGTRTQSQTMNCHQIIRNVYIYKTTIEIHIVNGELTIQFQYHCLNPCRLDFGVGVKGIQQNQQTKQITNVDCLKSFNELLPPNEKGKFSKSYKFEKNELKNVLALGMMMKISWNNQCSEYSLAYIQNTKLWKVVVETFHKDAQLFGIQDIYGGGQQGQQCIICFTQRSTTMVKPCNHLCLCQQCAKIVQGQSKNCPICRKNIISLVTIRKE